MILSPDDIPEEWARNPQRLLALEEKVCNFHPRSKSGLIEQIKDIQVFRSTAMHILTQAEQKSQTYPGNRGARRTVEHYMGSLNPILIHGYSKLAKIVAAHECFPDVRRDPKFRHIAPLASKENIAETG